MHGLDLAPVGDILFHVKLPIDLAGHWLELRAYQGFQVD